MEPTATADAPSQEGDQAIVTIAQGYTVHTGVLSSKIYKGKVYANREMILLCADTDLSKRSIYMHFGLIGALALHFANKKVARLDVSTMPKVLRDQLAKDRLSPIDLQVIPKTGIIRIDTGLMSGVKVVSERGKYGLNYGLFGKKSLLAKLRHLGFAIA